MSADSSAAVPHVQSTLAKISVCRTAALGSKLYGCRSCGEVKRVHHSCGDRHCPQCRGASRVNWVDSAATWVLPNMDYYQVVFTIPDCLSSLTLGNRRVMFDLLFRSAWSSLKKTVEDEQQFEAAAAMVLHTWNQKLDAHVHVHAVVPGGGPSLQKENAWKSAEPPPGREYHDFWLVDADTLRTEFRKQFLRGLKRLHQRGQLKLDGQWSDLRDADAFESWLSPLETIDWVAYIQPPPTGSSQPFDVVKYLARYLTGGPISDYRITNYDGHNVTFTARSGTVHGGSDETEAVELPAVEFIRRWCLHILPKGYTKSRRFGGLSNQHSKRYLNQCRKLLDDASGKETVDLSDTDQGQLPGTNSDPPEQCCHHCGSPLHLMHTANRTSWRDIFHGSLRPAWYAPPSGYARVLAARANLRRSTHDSVSDHGYNPSVAANHRG
ncbi:MAG: transposase [Planctomycetaceae bacterium]